MSFDALFTAVEQQWQKVNQFTDAADGLRVIAGQLTGSVQQIDRAFGALQSQSHLNTGNGITALTDRTHKLRALADGMPKTITRNEGLLRHAADLTVRAHTDMVAQRADRDEALQSGVRYAGMYAVKLTPEEVESAAQPKAWAVVQTWSEGISTVARGISGSAAELGPIGDFPQQDPTKLGGLDPQATPATPATPGAGGLGGPAPGAAPHGGGAAGGGPMPGGGAKDAAAAATGGPSGSGASGASSAMGGPTGGSSAMAGGGSTGGGSTGAGGLRSMPAGLGLAASAPPQALPTSGPSLPPLTSSGSGTLPGTHNLLPVDALQPLPVQSTPVPAAFKLGTAAHGLGVNGAPRGPAVPGSSSATTRTGTTGSGIPSVGEPAVPRLAGAAAAAPTGQGGSPMMPPPMMPPGMGAGAAGAGTGQVRPGVAQQPGGPGSAGASARRPASGKPKRVGVRPELLGRADDGGSGQPVAPTARTARRERGKRRPPTEVLDEELWNAP